jgi:DNA-binding GntR family transcriptional regulator
MFDLARTLRSADPLPLSDNDAFPTAGGGILTVSHDWSPELQKARVYEQLLLDIILGELAPNARLDEQVLVRRYKAGLAGVRDALGRLAREGLVIRRARSGTTVAALDLVELGHAQEVRSLLEPHCAYQAAAQGSDADIAHIVQAFEGGEAAARAGDSRALVAMDQRFHAAMARASGNAVLARTLIPLQHKAARFWVYTMGADTEEERLAEVERHQGLATRIAERDPEGARLTAMRILKIFPDNVRRVAR